MRLAAAVSALLLLVFSGTAVQAAQITHRVLPGESLSRIAKHYRTTPDRIRKLNHLKSDQLRQGQKLKVHSAVPVAPRVRGRHPVRKGESLSQIAKQHHMSIALLRRLNPNAPSKLRAGQLLWVVKESPAGSRRSLYQLEPGPGFTIQDPGHAYGTMLTITRLAEVLSEEGLRNPNKAPVLIGDISRKGGGFLAPHASHRRGQDVDIRYPLKVPSKRWVSATAASMDLKRTWTLIQAFIRTGDVIYVFVDYKLQRALYEYAQEQGASGEKLHQLFQYPRGPRSMSGIIRHEPGHKTHFHVRFKPESEGTGPNA